MNKSLCRTAIISCFSLLALLGACTLASAYAPTDRCLQCHSAETQTLVKQWEEGKHSKTGVKCYVCHFAEPGSAGAEEHNGFSVITKAPVSTCYSCHPDNASKLRGEFPGSDSRHP